MLRCDPYSPFDYLSLTQLGSLFGVSALKAGSWLTQLRLRGSGGEPVEKAKQAGMARLFHPDTGLNPFWTWEKTRSVRMLEEVGGHPLLPQYAGDPEPSYVGDPPFRHVGDPAPLPQPPAPPPPRLVGPFTPRPNDGDGFEIVDANGNVGVWCRGTENAQVLAKLMNLCVKAGRGFC